MLHLPAPRLLPMTIVALSALLAAKSIDLVRAAIPDAANDRLGFLPHTMLAALAPAASDAGGMVPAAHAATPEPAAPPKPAAGAAPAAGLAGGAPGAAKTEPPISDAERTVLLELRQRRQELDRRDAALSAREAVLSAAEHRLAAQVDQLQALQKQLQALDAARKQREDAGWQGLVKLYETMKPRDAAAIFNDLDMPVLLQVVDRMKESKAAPVLAAMRVDKARELTDQLAQMRAKRNAVGGAS